MTKEIVHAREDTAIIACSAEHHSVIAESILDNFSHIFSCQVTNYNLFHSSLFKHISKHLGSNCCIAMDRSVSDKHSLALRLISAPCVIET